MRIEVKLSVINNYSMLHSLEVFRRFDQSWRQLCGGEAERQSCYNSVTVSQLLSKVALEN